MSQQKVLAGIARKILVLHDLNRCPESPSDAEFYSKDHQSRIDNEGRVLSLKQEHRLAQAFALLVSNSDDPTRVAAACVEEIPSTGAIQVKFAVNRGDLNTVQKGLQRVASILQHLARGDSGSDLDRTNMLYAIVELHQNRILGRLSSKHAILKCQYKSRKKDRSPWIPGLCAGIVDHISDANVGFDTLTAQFQTSQAKNLVSFFQHLENLSTDAARSRSGLELIMSIVQTCERLTMHKESYERVSSLHARLASLEKVSRYVKISELLVRYARRFGIFRKVKIIPVHLNPMRCSVMEPTRIDARTLQKPCKKPFAQTAHSLSRGSEQTSPQTVVLKHPVHAEIQLLFHYELTKQEHQPRVICSNKKACFLCKLFFKLHGKFLVPSSHGRLYEKWTLPIDLLNMTRTQQKSTMQVVQRFDSEISQLITRELELKRKPLPLPAESIIFQHKSESSITTPRSGKMGTDSQNVSKIFRSRTLNTTKQSLLATISSRALSRQIYHRSDRSHSSCIQSSGNRADASMQTCIDHATDNASIVECESITDSKETTLEADKSLTILYNVGFATKAIDTELSWREFPPKNSFTEQTASTSQSSSNGRRSLELQKGNPQIFRLSRTVEDFDLFASHIHLELTLPQKLCTHKPVETCINEGSPCLYWDFVYVTWLSTEQKSEVDLDLCINIEDLTTNVDYIEKLIEGSQGNVFHLRVREEVIRLHLGSG